MNATTLYSMPLSDRIVGIVEEWDAWFHFPCQYEYLCYRVGLGNWVVRLLVDKLARDGRLSWAGDDVTIAVTV